jgi:hypothetical protein
MEQKRPDHVYHLFLNIVTSGTIHEYRGITTVEDLQTSEELSWEDAMRLHALVNYDDDEMDDAVELCLKQIYNRSTADAMTILRMDCHPNSRILEYFEESLHNSLDGWPEQERPTFLRVIHDLALFLEAYNKPIGA